MTSHITSSIKPLKERIATIGVFLANGFGIGAWAVEVPRIKESLALSDTALGIALFAFALGAIVAMPLAGQLAPRFGSGRATSLLGAAFVVALPLPAVAPGMAALCIVLFILGAANGALRPRTFNSAISPSGVKTTDTTPLSS